MEDEHFRKQSILLCIINNVTLKNETMIKSQNQRIAFQEEIKALLHF